MKTPAAWQTFVSSSVDDDAWTKTCSAEGNCDELSAFREHVRRDILDVFSRCSEDLADNPRIARCTERLRRFSPQWMRQHETGSYGFAESNHDYLAQQTASDKPTGMMDPPAEIVAALPERSRIEEVARVNGWPFVTHDSCFGGVRTFITVADPENRFEQWFLVRFDADAKRVPNNSVMSFIAVQKRDAVGRKLSKVRLHFRDYIAWDAGGSWRLALPEVHDGKCYACHGSGMRLLVPTHESVVVSAPVKGEPGFGASMAPADFGHRRLVELNGRLASYGVPDWSGSIDPDAQGPALGESLGCASCHDGTSRGALTLFTDVGTYERKIVDELSMQAFTAGNEVPDVEAIALLDREKTRSPPLSTTEAQALTRARSRHLADHRTFMAERFPAWKAWALSERCE